MILSRNCFESFFKNKNNNNFVTLIFDVQYTIDFKSNVISYKTFKEL